jgi:hypothetical protein
MAKGRERREKGEGRRRTLTRERETKERQNTERAGDDGPLNVV